MAFAAMKSLAAVLLMVMFVAVVSAQDLGELSPASAPAPTPDKGAASAYSFGMSSAGAVVCSSLFLSMLAVVRQ